MELTRLYPKKESTKFRKQKISQLMYSNYSNKMLGFKDRYETVYPEIFHLHSWIKFLNIKQKLLASLNI